MAIILFIVFGAITAFLAKRKGYNPYIWFFAAGVIGLIVLAFLPSTNVETLSEDQKKAAQKKGNIIASVLVLVVFVIILTMVKFVFSRGKFMELKAEAQKASCSADLGNIRTALSNYYAHKAMSSSSGDANLFPPSLHDSGFLQSSNLEGGKLPDHPCGKDWNDFYNSTDGRLNSGAACDCQ